MVFGMSIFGLMALHFCTDGRTCLVGIVLSFGAWCFGVLPLFNRSTLFLGTGDTPLLIGGVRQEVRSVVQVALWQLLVSFARDLMCRYAMLRF